MTYKTDLTGMRFERLLVVARAPDRVWPSGQTQTQYFCKCDCGNEKIVLGNSLSRGVTRSCGCLHKEGTHFTHRKSHHRIYRIYNAMKNRCYNPNTPRYSDYGGRSITICDEWLDSFMSFYNWAINNGYDEKLSIDRINNNEGYSPSNCKWATAKEQNNNQRIRKDSRLMVGRLAQA